MKRAITASTFLKAAFAATIALSAAPVAAQTVKIGVLTTQSGPDTEYGVQTDRGIDLYMKNNANKLPAGVKVEILRRDDGGPNPDKAKQLAQELFVRDKVQFLTGLVWTPNTIAITPLATEAKVPMVIMGGSAPSVIPRMSPYVVRFSYNITQLTTPMAQWTAKKYKRAYVAVNDFAPGHETESAFEKAFAGPGREIVGKVRIPLSSADYTPFMQRIKDAKPDVLFMFIIGGPHMTAMLKAAAELGFDKAGIALVSTTDPGDANQKLPDAAVGMLSGYYYTTSADRPANKAFVEAYRKEYGDKHSPNPDWVAATAYDAMDGIYHAIREQNGRVDPDKSMELFKGYKNPNSPRGPISINPQTRDIVQNIYLREVRRVGNQLISVELEPLGP